MKEHDPRCMTLQAWGDIPNSCTCYLTDTLTMDTETTTPGYRAHLPNFVREVQVWQQATFPEATPQSIVAHLRSEVAELCEHLDDPEEMADGFLLLIGLAGSQKEDLFGTIDDDKFREGLENLSFDLTQDPSDNDARAGMLLLLLGLAFRRNINLLDAGWNKLEKNKKRKWGERNEQGFVEHVEEGA